MTDDRRKVSGFGCQVSVKGCQMTRLRSSSYDGTGRCGTQMVSILILVRRRFGGLDWGLLI